MDTSVSGQVGIRWNATNKANNSDVNVAAVLFNDGRIRFDYGGGNANLWYGWDTEILDLEPTSFLIANYKSDSPLAKVTFGVKIDALDALLVKLGTELNLDKRKEMTREAERLLLKAYGGGRPYSHVQITNTLAWNYWHGPESAPFSTAHLMVNAWIDPDDPTYQGRPSDAGLV